MKVGVLFFYAFKESYFCSTIPLWDLEITFVLESKLGFPQVSHYSRISNLKTSSISQVTVKLMKMITALKISYVSFFLLSKYWMKNCLIFRPRLM